MQEHSTIRYTVNEPVPVVSGKTQKETECYVHLPSIRIPGMKVFNIGAEKMCKIPFEEWYEIDQSFVWAQKHYDNASPVFFRFNIPCDLTDDDAISEFYSSMVDKIYRALVLSPGYYYIPRPENSCSYFIFHNNDSDQFPEIIQGPLVRRYVGPFEREWLIFGNGWNNDYDENALLDLKKTYEDITCTKVLDEIEDEYGGFALLQEISEPEFLLTNIIPGQGCKFDVPNSLVRSVSWLENILIPEKKEERFNLSLTKAFGYFVGLMTTTEYEKLDNDISFYSSLYTLRSKLIHGEINTNSLSEHEYKSCRFSIALTVLVLRKIIAYHLSGQSNLPLSSALLQLLYENDGRVLVDQVKFKSFRQTLDSIL